MGDLFLLVFSINVPADEKLKLMRKKLNLNVGNHGFVSSCTPQMCTRSSY
jgi:hypothetical protein